MPLPLPLPLHLHPKHFLQSSLMTHAHDPCPIRTPNFSIPQTYPFHSLLPNLCTNPNPPCLFETLYLIPTFLIDVPTSHPHHHSIFITITFHFNIAYPPPIPLLPFIPVFNLLSPPPHFHLHPPFPHLPVPSPGRPTSQPQLSSPTQRNPRIC